MTVNSIVQDVINEAGYSEAPTPTYGDAIMAFFEKALSALRDMLSGARSLLGRVEQLFHREPVQVDHEEETVVHKEIDDGSRKLVTVVPFMEPAGLAEESFRY
jgi:hypothetical protein